MHKLKSHETSKYVQYLLLQFENVHHIFCVQQNTI